MRSSTSGSLTSPDNTSSSMVVDVSREMAVPSPNVDSTQPAPSIAEIRSPMTTTPARRIRAIGASLTLGMRLLSLAGFPAISMATTFASSTGECLTPLGFVFPWRGSVTG